MFCNIMRSNLKDEERTVIEGEIKSKVQFFP